jgi:membrane protein
MAVMLAHLKVPLSWWDILKRTFYEGFWKDNVLGMAAQLAYYFFFALFPALLFLLAVASYFPIDTLIDDIVARLSRFAPPDVVSIITGQIEKISNDESGGLLTAGMLITIWSSSAAMTAIIDTVNRAYGIVEGRPWWKVRLVAMSLTVGVSLFILVSFALIIVGPTLAERVADAMRLGPAFEWTWKILQWPVVFALASAGVAMVYYFAPDAEQDWIWLTPGSVFATALWILASLGFKYYVANLGNYTETYGVIGTAMVLMLWFYISGLVILLGAEMNAEIEHASPYGKDDGEKIPGEKRKIGPARMRAWLAAKRKGQKAPSADDLKEALDHVPTRPARRAPGNWPPAGVIAMQDRERSEREQARVEPERTTVSPELTVPPAPAGPPPTRAQLPPARRFSDILIGLGVIGTRVYWAARRFKPKRGA